MDNKGPIWLIIFFLIILFVLINTLNITEYSTPFKVTARNTDGRISLAEVEQIKPPADAPGEVYQSFTVEPKEGLKLTIDVNSAWQEQHLIADDTMSVHLLTDGGWVERPTERTRRYDKENIYEASDIHGGTYVISGTPGTLIVTDNIPSTRAQLGILIIVITLLLFIRYHHFGNQEVKKHAPSSISELNVYIRECLLAGHDDKDVRKRLVSAGWKEQDVDQGLRRARFF